MNEKPLPRDRRSEEQLQQKLASLALAPLQGQASSPQSSRPTGKIFQLETNDLGLEKASFSFNGDGCLLTFKDNLTAHPIACGSGRWHRGETGLPGTPPRLIGGGAPPKGTKFKVAASGAWTDPSTFQVMLRYYETPHHDTVTCRFDGDTVRIGFLSSIAAMSASPKDPRPVLQGRIAS
jgi:hypothetical protein